MQHAFRSKLSCPMLDRDVSLLLHLPLPGRNVENWSRDGKLHHYAQSRMWIVSVVFAKKEASWGLIINEHGLEVFSSKVFIILLCVLLPIPNLSFVLAYNDLSNPRVAWAMVYFASMVALLLLVSLSFKNVDMLLTIISFNA